MKNNNSKLLSSVNNINKDYYMSVKNKLILFFLNLLHTSIKILLALAFAYLVNNIKSISTKQILFISLFVIITLLVSFTVSYYYNILIEKFVKIVIKQTQEDNLEKYSKTQTRELENIVAGNWVNLNMKDIVNCCYLYPHVIIPFITGILFFVITIIIGAYISTILTIVVLITSFVSVFLPKILTSKIVNSNQEMKYNQDYIQDYVINQVDSFDIIKSYNYSKNTRVEYEECYENYSISAVEAKKQSSKLLAISIGSGYTISGIWLMFGIYLVYIGNLTVGEYVLFMMLSDYFNWPFFSASELVALANEYIASFNRVQEFKTLDNDVYSESDAHNSSLVNVKDVSFMYGDKQILNELSLEINKGEKVALIGQSGTGKTTLIKLILGLYYPERGSVSINSDKQYKQSSIAKSVSYVSQTNKLISGTIRENITCGANIDDDTFINAVKIACVDEFIEKLPNKYETLIGEEESIELSGGQIQRIALARALCKDVELYILDEYSSALDPKIENIITDNLMKMHKTMIFVAHREDLIQKCDRVISL